MSLKDKYSPGKIGSIVDTVHIVIGIAVTVMTIMAIADTERFMVLFPLIFALGGILSGVTGWYAVVTYQKNTRRWAMIVMYFVVALLLLILFVASAVSLWFH